MGKILQARRAKGAKAAKSKAKKQKRLDATLYNPSEVLSGRDLRSSVNQLVKLETQPQIKAADRTAREARLVGNEQVRRSGEYGSQLDKTQAGNYSLQSALKDRATANLQTISSEESRKVDSSGQEAADRFAKDESVRGQGLEGGGEAAVALEAQAAKNRQAQTALSYRSAEEMAGTARQGLALAGRDVAINRSKETEGTLRNRTQATVNDALVKKQDVLASRGPLATQLALKMRGEEFEKLATVQGLGIKREDIAADAAAAAARTEATIRGQDIGAETSRSNNANTNATSAANNAATNATSTANNKRTNKNKGKGKGKSPTKTDAGVLSNINRTTAVYRRYKGIPQRDIFRKLVNSGKYSEAEIYAGADLATRGYVLPGTRRRFKGQLALLPRNLRTKTKDPTPGGQGKFSKRAPGGT